MVLGSTTPTYSRRARKAVPLRANPHDRQSVFRSGPPYLRRYTPNPTFISSSTLFHTTIVLLRPHDHRALLLPPRSENFSISVSPIRVFRPRTVERKTHAGC